MQGLKTIPSTAGRIAPKRVKQAEHKQRHIKPSADNPEIGQYTNGFLKSIVKPIPASIRYPIASEDNFWYLYKSAQNFASIIGCKFTYVPDNISFRTLCEKFTDSLAQHDSTYYAAIIEDEDRLKFNIYTTLDNSTLYYIPVSIIHRLKGKFKALVTDFFSMLYHNQRLMPNEEQHERYFIEKEMDYLIELGEANPEYFKQLERYYKGDIYQLFKEIEEPNILTIDILRYHFENHKTNRRKEKKLIRLMLKGLDLMDSEKVLYDYILHDLSASADSYILSYQCLFRLIYDDDEILGYIIEDINNDGQEGAECLYSSCTTLTDQTRQLDPEDTFPKQFIQWVEELTSYIYEY